jgi:hypothetical protein
MRTIPWKQNKKDYKTNNHNRRKNVNNLHKLSANKKHALTKKHLGQKQNQKQPKPKKRKRKKFKR